MHDPNNWDAIFVNIPPFSCTTTVPVISYQKDHVSWSAEIKLFREGRAVAATPLAVTLRGGRDPFRHL